MGCGARGRGRQGEGRKWEGGPKRAGQERGAVEPTAGAGCRVVSEARSFRLQYQTPPWSPKGSHHCIPDLLTLPPAAASTVCPCPHPPPFANPECTPPRPVPPVRQVPHHQAGAVPGHHRGPLRHRHAAPHLRHHHLHRADAQQPAGAILRQVGPLMGGGQGGEGGEGRAERGRGRRWQEAPRSGGGGAVGR